MSSPTTTTPVSRSISCAIPSAMARAVVSLRPDCPAGAPSAEVVVSVALIGLPPSREDVVKRRLRRGNRAGLGELDRLLDPGRCLVLDGLGRVRVQDAGLRQDRKSTRLNSSHVAISYAVFCLKKKKNT